jgi:multidrug resistance efflux pump
MVQPRGTSAPEADPIEAPNVPAPTRRPPNRGSFRKWRARLIVLLLVVAAVLIFIRISASRTTESHRIDLGTVTMTAQPIPVEVAQTGLVTAVSVVALQKVTAGQKIGTVEVTGTDADGDPKVRKVTVTAPSAGIVVDQPATVGSTVQPGQPFLRLYDPAQVTFITAVSLKNLPEIAPSMTATLQAEGIDRKVRAKVQRVVPRVGTDGTAAGVNPNTLPLVLVPASASEVQGLVPGMRFTGYVDTVSGTPGSGRLVS